MQHIMKLKKIYFNMIKNGEKIYEIRLNDEKRQLIKINDKITFLKEPDKIETLEITVVDLAIFKSFNEMLENINPAKIGFDNTPKNKIIDIYHKFYSQEDEQKYGVLAIKVKVDN